MTSIHPNGTPPADPDITGTCCDCGDKGATYYCGPCGMPLCQHCRDAKTDPYGYDLCDDDAWTSLAIHGQMFDNNQRRINAEDYVERRTEELVDKTLKYDYPLRAEFELELALWLCGVEPTDFYRELRQRLERTRRVREYQQSNRRENVNG